MKLIPWQARPGDADPMSQLRREVDRLFDEAFAMPFAAGEARPRPLALDRALNGNWMPALDVSESDAEITLRLEVPGIDAKALNIAVTGNMLTVSGEKKEESERKGEDFYHRERRFGAFRRTIELPDGADADKITAEYTSGIATIHVPRKPGVKTRQVEVRTASASPAGA